MSEQKHPSCPTKDAFFREDAEPIGPVLAGDAFHEGRLHMLRREDDIYRAYRMATRDTTAPECALHQDTALPPEECLRREQALVAGQEEELSLFNQLLAAGTTVHAEAEQEGQPAPSHEPETSETPSHAVYTSETPGTAGAPGFLSSQEFPQAVIPPEGLDPYFQRFLASVRQDGFLGGASGKGAFSPAFGGTASSPRYYGVPDPKREGRNMDPQGGSSWIHIREYDPDTANKEEPIFPHRRTQPSKYALPFQKKLEGAAKNSPPPNARTVRRELMRQFLKRLTRIAALVGLIGIGYIIMMNKGCGV